MQPRSWHVTRAPRLSLLAGGLSATLLLAGQASAGIQPPPAPPPTASTPPSLAGIDLRALQRMLAITAGAPARAPGNALPVTNCGDSGPGSLRDAVAAAADDDTIDLTQLDCSKITLTTGAIEIGVDTLTLVGPRMLGVEISGNDSSRVFHHTGHGAVSLRGMMVTHGRTALDAGATGSPDGACIRSTGSVYLHDTWIKYCSANSAQSVDAVRGGAVFAAGKAIVSQSFISDNSAYHSARQARGGGVYAGDGLALLSSIVSGNHTGGALGGTGGGVQAGSMSQLGSVATDGSSIKYSTIADNEASKWGGGAYITGDARVERSAITGNQAGATAGAYFVMAATYPVTISNSTISGNHATTATAAAGVGIWGNPARIHDSTIAFNTVTAAGNGSTLFGTGVRVCTATLLELHNTIVANNSRDFGSGTVPDDIGGIGSSQVIGSNNLVYSHSAVAVPADTLVGIDPLLLPLDFHGAITKIHMPMPGSPVIDAGNNLSGAVTDQRGPGFARVHGGRADIGAAEYGADTIFAHGFEF
ncbi:hypothetical protein FBQ98_01640 [Gammaproteobacteria bacterium PRO6]|nr:hypothetical protein [Gammaproteobacteria bacterium PRO6]